ncbi:hypothetical protein MHYP_G00009870 [Metynnis hypsauchen]
MVLVWSNDQALTTAFGSAGVVEGPSVSLFDCVSVVIGPVKAADLRSVPVCQGRGHRYISIGRQKPGRHGCCSGVKREKILSLECDQCRKDWKGRAAAETRTRRVYPR